jgi:plasmid stability protein
MATLMIRQVEPHLKERLRLRAARHGRSMEAELREILRDALRSEEQVAPDLAEAIRRRFAPLGGVELQPFPPTPVREPPAFE